MCLIKRKLLVGVIGGFNGGMSGLKGFNVLIAGLTKQEEARQETYCSGRFISWKRNRDANISISVK